MEGNSLVTCRVPLLAPYVWIAGVAGPWMVPGLEWFVAWATRSHMLRSQHEADHTSFSLIRDCLTDQPVRPSKSFNARPLDVC